MTLKSIFIFLTFLCLFFSLAWYLKIGLNLTSSLPKGLYKVSEIQELKHGDVVKFCLDDKTNKEINAEPYVGYGVCKNGLKPLLKYVAGLEGDLVEINKNKVFIKLKHKSVSIAMRIYDVDSKGEKVKSILKDGIIPKGKAFVYSTNDGSFDSRYFGLVNKNELVRMEEFITF